VPTPSPSSELEAAGTFEDLTQLGAGEDIIIAVHIIATTREPAEVGNGPSLQV
jgi:hypothetical protein